MGNKSSSGRYSFFNGKVFHQGNFKQPQRGKRGCLNSLTHPALLSSQKNSTLTGRKNCKEYFTENYSLSFKKTDFMEKREMFGCQAGRLPTSAQWMCE